ncbi:MAG: sulfotransferase [Blastocatellales bacterium]
MAKLSVDQMLHRAKSHERKGELEQARALYRSVLQDFPGNTRARQALAQLGEAGQSADAGRNPPQDILDHLMGLYHRGQHAAVAEQALRLTPAFPDSFVLWNLLGASGAQAGRRDIAEKAFRRASELNPSFPDAHSNLGNILKEQGRLDEAAACYARALELNPDFAAAHNNLGNVLRNQGRLDEAVASFTRALALRPDFVDAHCNLFELHEKSNRLDAARDAIAAMQRVFPVLPAELKLRKAIYHFRMKEYDAVIAEIRGIGDGTLRGNQEIRRLELLSKALEKANHYDDAFLYMHRMNALIVSTYRELDGPATRYLEHIEARRLDLQSASRERPAGSRHADQAGPVFLVGFPRSGTTLLDTFLRGHPEVEVIEEKPMVALSASHFGEFRPLQQIEALGDDELGLMRRLYFDELKKHVRSEGRNIVIDKFPLNLIYAPEMHALFPNARYILALRHPLDCMLSNYKQNFRLNAPMYLMSDLAKASALYDNAMSIFRLCRERYGLRVHDVRYEDLTHDAEGVIRSLVTFLGMEWDSGILDHKQTARQRRMIDTPSYSQVVEDVYKDSTNLWKRYEAHLKPFIPRMRYWMDQFGYI